MKKLLSLLLVLSVFITLGWSQKLVILHTNDIHSKITGFGPELAYTPLTTNDDKTVGGFARLATIIKQEKKKNADKLLVLDAGDFLMGTIFQALEPQTGFELDLMKKIGIDYTTLGNHEFDFGTNVLGDIINSAVKNGPIPQIVASSLKFSPLPGDDKLEKLYNDGVIKPYVVLKKNGLKIGIFGLLGYNAVEDIKFAAPLQFEDMVKVARKYVKFLRNKEHVDIIILLSHSGFYPDGKGGYYGEDLDLARKVKDIDIIISGHTHIAAPQYIKVGKTIIVQTGCYLHNVGRMELEYKDGKVNVLNYKLIHIDDKIMGDSNVCKIVNAQKKLIDKEILSPLGLEYSTPIGETSFDVKRGDQIKHVPGAMGNFVGDADKYYVDKYAGGCDVVVSAEGVIREDFLTGPITPADAYRVMPLGFGIKQKDYTGYPLMRVYITGHELKQLMELALFSNKPGTDKYLYFSGVKVYYNPKGGFLNKVKKIVLSNGDVVDMSRRSKKLYSLVTNSYIMSFIGSVKKMSYGLIKIVPKDKQGNRITDLMNRSIDFDPNKPGVQEGKEWLALISYIKSFKDTNGDGLPDIPQKYAKFNNNFIPLSK